MSKVLDASTVSIISNAGVMVAFVASIFLYGESVTIEKVLGVGLVILALVLVSFVWTSGLTTSTSILFF